MIAQGKSLPTAVVRVYLFSHEPCAEEDTLRRNAPVASIKVSSSIWRHVLATFIVLLRMPLCVCHCAFHRAHVSVAQRLIRSSARGPKGRRAQDPKSPRPEEPNGPRAQAGAPLFSSP